MSSLFQKLRGAIRRFRNAEDGGMTIEFILLMPVAMLFFTSSLEAGLLSTRQVMLERGVDITVRKVRIGQIPIPTHDGLKAEICNAAAIIPNCLNSIRLEMVVKQPRAFTPLSSTASCVDREEEGVPVLNFTGGDNNELMILRVCSLFEPMLPYTTFGTAIPKRSGAEYALVATSSFVMEPFK
jgi:hypothetical protein